MDVNYESIKCKNIANILENQYTFFIVDRMLRGALYGMYHSQLQYITNV